MTMEAGLIHERRRDHNTISHHMINKVGYTNSKVMMINKKRKKKIKPCKSKVCSSSTLQELFVSCKSLFKGPGTVPMPSDVENLCCILDKMRPEDVGLSKDLQFFNPETFVKGTPRVTFTNMYLSDKFSLCIFFLPANATIPLHNHPEMTVFSKLLLGKMHIKAYDWVDPTASVSSSKLRLAKLKADRVFTAPCNTSVLYPTTGGNIHAFTAITPCAVLDVIGPPYSKNDGRDCSYYKDDHPCNTLSHEDNASVSEAEGGSYGWLEEIEMPVDSEMDAIEYLGPKIIDIAIGH